MSDLINRQNAIDVLEILADKMSDEGKTVMTQAVAVLKDLRSAEPEWKWIPVTEALPEKKEMVLITNNKGHVRCGQYQGTFDDKNYRWWWKHNTLEEVLVWMPLPKSYKE